MFKIDVRSLLLVTGVMGVLLSMVLFFLRRSFPAQQRKDLANWIAAPTVLFVATSLLGARGLLPDWLSLLLGNGMVWLGTLLYYFGSQRFLGQQSATRPWGVLWLLALGTMAWYTYGNPSPNPRLLVSLIFLSAICAAHGAFLVRYGPPKVATRLCIAVLSIQCLNFGVRGLSALDPSGSYQLFDENLMQGGYMALNGFGALMLNVGLLLMATDRLLIEFERLATQDSLTGTLTRRAFLAACDDELERVRRHGRAMSLLVLDLDHFKSINDKHGHQVGDQVLTQFVQRLGSLLRRPDRLGRYGGEEFVMLLPETSTADALAVAQRLCDCASANGGTLPTITVSIGVSTSRTDDPGVDALMGRADAAMYRAKALGRNRVEAG